MNEIKTDLFPEALRAGRKKEKQEETHSEGQRDSQSNAVTSVEPLPESSRPRKDGPGGE